MVTNPTDPGINPYAPPEADLAAAATGAVDPSTRAEAEQVRRTCIGYEAAVRSAGCLQVCLATTLFLYLGWFLAVVAGGLGAPPGAVADGTLIYGGLGLVLGT